jgi:L-asparagine oxygenase
MLRIELPERTTAELYQRFHAVSAHGDEIESLLPDLVQCSAFLPRDLLRELLAFRTAPHAPGALLITGLPVDANLPSTPVHAQQPPYKPGRISECSILGIAILLGEPVAYAAEKHGALVQDVFPTRSEEAAPSNESSAVSLGFHTELTFSRQSPHRPYHHACPDFVLLFALRCHAERSAVTQVIDARDICGGLEVTHLEELRREHFQLQAPYSFTRDDERNRPWSVPVALLRGSASVPSFAFDTACGVRALTPDAEMALEALRNACNNPAIHGSVRLRAGDLLVINNKRCAHARSRFPAAFDGLDRWLQRAYVRHTISDLAPDDGASYRVLN